MQCHTHNMVFELLADGGFRDVIYLRACTGASRVEKNKIIQYIIWLWCRWEYSAQKISTIVIVR